MIHVHYYYHYFIFKVKITVNGKQQQPKKTLKTVFIVCNTLTFFFCNIYWTDPFAIKLVLIVNPLSSLLCDKIGLLFSRWRSWQGSKLPWMNLCSHLEPELSRPVISQNTMDCNNVPPYEVWLQNDQRYKKYFGNSYSLIYGPPLWPWPWIKIMNPLQDIVAFCNASPFHVWLQNILNFGQYCPNKRSLNFWTCIVTSWRQQSIFLSQ